MKTSTHINKFLLSLLVVFFSDSIAQTPITHLQLVQTWIPTFCNTSDIKCVPLLGAKFAMHGLWPAGISGKSVENCGRSPVPEHVFRELQADLHRTWPPIVLGRPERSLWSHEWKVHGTCANMSQKSYFEAAIKHKNGIDLLSLLKSANITPTMDRTYKIKDIIEAVQKGSGGVGINNVYVSCRGVNTTHVWLREIFVCFNTTKTRSKDYVSCPVSSDTRGCGGPKKQNNIILPTAQTLVLSTDHLHYEYKGESSIAERLEGEI